MESNIISICSVGDLMPCDSPLYVSVGVGTNYSKIRGRLYSACRETLKLSDITIGNLEAVYHKPRKNNLKERQMSCSKKAISDLKAAGFNVLNIANNHCLQHGVSSFYETAKICNELGITVVGRKNEDICYMEVKNETVAFLSLCLVFERYQPSDIQYEDDIISTFKKIKSIREKEENALVVVSIHWGDEFTTFPSNAQIALAHKLIDSGANLILGHHSHVFQGIEEYHSGLIAYSQGNFVSDMKPGLCTETGIVKIEAQRCDSGFELKYSVDPYRINQEFILEKNDGLWLKQRQDDLNKALEAQISDDDYWRKKTENHKICHDIFKSYFISNIRRYNLRISIKMMYDFVSRKIGKVRGSYVFGRKSSMDGKIYDELKAVEGLQ